MENRHEPENNTVHKRLLQNLLLLAAAPLLLMVLFMPLWFYIHASQTTDQQEARSIEAFSEHIDSAVQHIETISSLFAVNNGVLDILKGKHPEQSPIMQLGTWSMLHLEVFDVWGSNRHSFSAPPGIIPANLPQKKNFIRSALRGNATTDIILAQDGLYLLSATPVYEKEPNLKTPAAPPKPSGAVLVVQPLGIPVLRHIAESLQRGTILIWGERPNVATSMTTTKGVPISSAWDTAPTVRDIPMFSRTEKIFDTNYNTRYAPLYNASGNVIAVLGVANPNALPFASLPFYATLMAGIVLSLVVLIHSRHVVRRALSPMQRLLNGVKEATTADHPQPIILTAEKEWMDLANAFNNLNTATHEKEKALQKAEKKYKDIFANALEGIFITTFEGNIVDANPALATMLGYSSPEEFIAQGKELHQTTYVDPTVRAHIVAELKKLSRIKNYEIELYRKDKSKIWASISVRVVNTPDDETQQHLEGSIVDITDKKAKEEKALEKHSLTVANKEKTELMDSIGQTLIAPINTISRLYAQSLSSESTHEGETAINTAIYYLKNFTLGLLEYSRSRVRTTNKEVSFDIRELLNEVAQSHHTHAGNVSITVDITSDIPIHIDGNKERLRLLLANLISQATWQQVSKGLLLSVSLAPPQQPASIGTPFPQKNAGSHLVTDISLLFSINILNHNNEASATSTNDFKTIHSEESFCTELIHSLRGKVTKRTKPLSYSFTIPFTHTKTPSVTTSPILNQIKSLLVSADTQDIGLLRLHMEKMNIAHTIASTAEQGLLILASSQVDVALIDIELPETNGITLIQQIRSNSVKTLNPNIPIIAYTSFSEPHFIEQCIISGATSVLVKPLRIETVSAEINRIITKNSEHSQNKQIHFNEASGLLILLKNSISAQNIASTQKIITHCETTPAFTEQYFRKKLTQLNGSVEANDWQQAKTLLAELSSPQTHTASGLS